MNLSTEKERRIKLRLMQDGKSNPLKTFSLSNANAYPNAMPLHLHLHQYPQKLKLLRWLYCGRREFLPVGSPTPCQAMFVTLSPNGHRVALTGSLKASGITGPRGSETPHGMIGTRPGTTEFVTSMTE